MRLAALWLALLWAGLAQAESPAVQQLLPASGTAEVLFSPWDDAEGRLIEVLDEAQASIHVQAYLLTSRSIAKALLQAHQRGIRVQLLADAEMVRNGANSQIPKLAKAGIPVWLENRYANAHNKLMLVDANGRRPIVITGSYNYTWSAQARNAENLLFLHDNPPLMQRYMLNWQRHRRDAAPYTAETE